jgi:hypothetical protein
MLVLLGGFVAAQGGTDEAAPTVGVSADLTGKFNIIDYDQYLPEGTVPKNRADTVAGTLAPDASVSFKVEDEGAGLTATLDLDELYFHIIQPNIDSDNNTIPAFTADDGTEFSVWIKPLKNDLIKLALGYHVGDATLRYGNLSSGDTIEGTGTVKVENYISGFGGNPYGFILSTKPIDPLFIGLGYRNPIGTGEIGTPSPADQSNDIRVGRIGDYLTGIQIGIGYEITGIGAARVQYVGPYALTYDPADPNHLYYVGNQVYDGSAPSAATAKFNTFELGFKVTALESIGLALDVVGQIPLGVTVKDGATYNGPVGFGVIANFATGAISVNGGVGLALGYDPNNKVEKDNTGIGFKAHVEPAYAINDALKVGADLGFAVKQTNAELPSGIDLGLGAFVTYTVGKGTLKAGLAATLEDFNNPEKDGVKIAKSHTIFKLPITVNVAY